jgi:hypothetical protein
MNVILLCDLVTKSHSHILWSRVFLATSAPCTRFLAPKIYPELSNTDRMLQSGCFCWISVTKIFTHFIFLPCYKNEHRSPVSECPEFDCWPWIGYPSWGFYVFSNYRWKYRWLRSHRTLAYVPHWSVCAHRVPWHTIQCTLHIHIEPHDCLGRDIITSWPSCTEYLHCWSLPYTFTSLCHGSCIG